MEIINKIILYCLPTIIALLAVFWLIKKFLDNNYQLRLLEVRQTMRKETTPLRLHAYERMCLFLERISINNLLVRVHKTGTSARELQTDLLTTVRTEFEHNLSQQIYISSPAWEMVKNAKEEVIRLINTAAATLKEDATGIELSKTIFEIMIKSEKIPAQKALEFLKKEVYLLL